MISLVLFCLLALFFGVCFVKLACLASERKSEGLGAACIALFIAICICLGTAAYRAAMLDNPDAPKAVPTQRK